MQRAQRLLGFRQGGRQQPRNTSACAEQLYRAACRAAPWPCLLSSHRLLGPHSLPAPAAATRAPGPGERAALPPPRLCRVGQQGGRVQQSRRLLSLPWGKHLHQTNGQHRAAQIQEPSWTDPQLCRTWPHLSSVFSGGEYATNSASNANSAPGCGSSVGSSGAKVGLCSRTLGPWQGRAGWAGGQGRKSA